MQSEINLLSHSCLLLLAIKLEPEQTPSTLVVTHDPLNMYVPDPQMIHWFEFGPTHVVQSGEQTAQDVPAP